MHVVCILCNIIPYIAYEKYIQPEACQQNNYQQL